MLRAVLAVIAGYAVWSTLWIFGGLGLGQVWPAILEESTMGDSTPALLGLLALSFACSVLAGWITASVRTGRPVWVMALLLLVTGIGVQSGIWERLPLWYHLVFLAAIVPLCVAGARFAPQRR